MVVLPTCSVLMNAEIHVAFTAMENCLRPSSWEDFHYSSRLDENEQSVLSSRGTQCTYCYVWQVTGSTMHFHDSQPTRLLSEPVPEWVWLRTEPVPEVVVVRLWTDLVPEHWHYSKTWTVRTLSVCVCGYVSLPQVGASVVCDDYWDSQRLTGTKRWSHSLNRLINEGIHAQLLMPCLSSLHYWHTVCSCAWHCAQLSAQTGHWHGLLRFANACCASANNTLSG